MRLAEINLLGVYVAPISVMMVAAWFVIMAPRRAPKPWFSAAKP